MKRRSGYNPKRKLAAMHETSASERGELSRSLSYKGNAEHKLYPNDYGLTPPASPRPGKTLCDAQRTFPRAEAESLLREGAQLGMVSVQRRNGWPQNIWAVNQHNQVFEAQLENCEQGHYHGYPMPGDDDFQSTIVTAWEQRKA